MRLKHKPLASGPDVIYNDVSLFKTLADGRGRKGQSRIQRTNYMAVRGLLGIYGFPSWGIHALSWSDASGTRYVR